MKSVLRLGLLCLCLSIIASPMFAQITGTKTIGGSSPDYPTIKAAFQDLTLQGTSAPGVTFLVRSGTYSDDTLIVRTTTSASNAPVTLKPDAGATVVINVVTGFNAALKIDSTRYVTIDGSNNGSSSRDLTINALSTGTQHGIYIVGQSAYTTVKNCNVRTNNITGSRGIYLSGTASGNANSSLIQNNLIRYAYMGIQVSGNSSADPITDLVLTKNIVDSSAIGGIYTGTTTRTQILYNDVNGLANYSGTKYAIFVGSNTLYTRVIGNKVHDMVQLSATAGTYGIAMSGTATAAQHGVYNNFVWGYNPQTAGSTSPYFALYSGTSNSTIPDTFAYNTVVLTGTSAGIKNTAAFYKGTATGGAIVKNNILYNARTDSTGISAAIAKLSAATLLVSNNNDLYVPLSGDTIHVTGAISTIRYKTVADWRAASITDESSFAENPPFVSSTDFHLQTTVPTQNEGGGIPIPGITTDYDGDVRNSLTPDVGADEFAGIRADLSSPVITYTPLNNTPLLGVRSLSASIADASGVPRAGMGLPVLYWRRNSGSYNTATGAWLSGTSYVFALGSGVTTGDTISYFIAAQDSITPPNVGVYPSGGASGFTANPPAASTPPTNPSRYLITQAPLVSGDYTIGLTIFEQVAGRNLTSQSFIRNVMKEVPVGPEFNKKAGNPFTAGPTPFGQTAMREIEETYSVLMENGHPYNGPTRILLTDDQKSRFGFPAEVMGVYPTITAAVADLNLRGVGGSVRFLLNDSTYASETFPIVVNVTSDSIPTAARTITFKPNTGVNVLLSGAAPGGAILKVINTNYVTIDGSNTANGTTRNLTLQNTSATSPQVLLFGSLGTNPITGGTLKNAIAINGTTTSSAIVISDGSTSGNPGYFSNITIQNNQIRKAYMALYINGGSATQNGSNVSVLSNTITATPTDSIRYVGVYASYVNGVTVRDNNIGGFSTPDGEIDRGIWLAAGTINAVVERNTVHDIGYTGTSGYAGKGIVVSSGLAGCNNIIRNNMISNITGDGDSYTSLGATYCPVGIYAFGATQTGVNVYYNTVNLYGNTLNYVATAYSIGIALDDGTTASVKNNLIINNLGLLGTVGVGPVGIAAEVSNAQFTALDYNNYYCNASSPALNAIGKIAGTDYATLAAWQTASGAESHSLNANVTFLSPSNLHISLAGPSPVDSAATPVAGITDDFDGQVRNASRPDIGADEFSIGGVAPIGVLAITRPVRVPNAGDSLVVTARIVDSTGVGITSDSLFYSVNGTRQPALAFPRTAGTNTDGTYRGVIPGSANTNGARIEYQILARSGSGGSITTAIVGANGYFAGISPLNLTGVRSMSASRQLLYANYYCKVTGTVNGPNFTILSGRISYTFQDAFGGMNMSRGSTTLTLNVGDSIVVMGLLGQFRGTTQLTPDSVNHITVVATGRPVPVTDLTVGAFNTNPEQYESMLIREASLQRIRSTPAWGTNVSIPVYQDVLRDSTLLFLDADTPVPAGTEPSYPVTVTGIGGQFTSSASVYGDGYEIIPRSSADLVPFQPTLNWSAQTSGITSQFYSVKAVSPTTAWAAAVGGIVLRTINGGSTWTSVGGGAIGTADIYAIDAISASTAFVTTTPAGGTRIYRTTDGGTTWTQVYIDTDAAAFIDAIKMLDANNGIAIGDPVGAKWVVLKTTDGGATWTRIATEPAQVGGEAGTQNDLATIGNNIWIGSSAGGRVYHSTDAGATWTSGTMPGATATTRVISVWFINATYGIAGHYTTSGVYNAARTTDGGATWSAITVNTATTYNIAVGSSGAVDFWMARGTDVYRSTDRGATWAQSYTGTGTFYDVDFVTAGASTYGWGVKDNGNIVAYFGTITGVKEQTNGQVPATFALEQNYPNPFNPETTIKFSVETADRTTLEIYNILGQKVATLFDGVAEAGQLYHVKMDGHNLASGVYLYRLQSGKHSALKKMVLLK